MTDQTTLAALLRAAINDQVDAPAIEDEDMYADLAARLLAAGVRVGEDVRGDPDEDVQEAVYRALLYVDQRTPRPMKPLAVIRALAQDGYRVVRVGDAGLREAAQAVVDAWDNERRGDVLIGPATEALRAALAGEEKP